MFQWLQGLFSTTLLSGLALKRLKFMGRNTNCKLKKKRPKTKKSSAKFMPYKNRRFKRKVFSKKDRRIRSAKTQSK